ncbi:MAG: ORF6N domain-containing protein [Terriglobia bacterium]
MDADLAELYEVGTNVLNRAVRRNLSRFPQGFMFEHTRKEAENLRFHFCTSSLRSQIATSRPLRFFFDRAHRTSDP